MLTEAETDALVDALHVRAIAAGWPEHTAENSRRWLQRGAVVVHVGPQVIAIQTWTGAILRECRMMSPDWPRLANEEFYGLEGEPVVNEAARLIAFEHVAVTEDDDTGHRVDDLCQEHGADRVLGCKACGLPVIERIGPCGCPRPRAWIGSGASGRPNHRAITGQIDHVRGCPGFDDGKSAVHVRSDLPVEPTEIVRPKRARVKIESLDLFSK